MYRHERSWLRSQPLVTLNIDSFFALLKSFYNFKFIFLYIIGLNIIIFVIFRDTTFFFFLTDSVKIKRSFIRWLVWVWSHLRKRVKKYLCLFINSFHIKNIKIIMQIRLIIYNTKDHLVIEACYILQHSDFCLY